MLQGIKGSLMKKQYAVQSPWVPVAFILLSMISLYAGASLAKTLFPAVGATGAISLRLGFGALLLLAVFRPWKSRLSTMPWRMLIGYGLSLGAMNTLFYLALKTVPLGIAIALEFTGPFALAILGSRRIRDFAWMLMALAGLLLLMPWSHEQASLDPLGVALALGAGVCWALYIVFGQKAGADHGSQSVAIGTLFAAVIAVPTGAFHAGWALLSPSLLPAGIGVAILTVFIPYTLEMKAMTRIPAATYGMLMSLEPAVGALCGMLFLHEHLTGFQWLAVALVVFASAGVAQSVPVTAAPLATDL